MNEENRGLRETYDKLADSYTSKHRTTWFFSLIQDVFLTNAILSTRKINPKNLEDMDVLNIGCGKSNEQSNNLIEMVFISNEQKYSLVMNKIVH